MLLNYLTQYALQMLHLGQRLAHLAPQVGHLAGDPHPPIILRFKWHMLGALPGEGFVFDNEKWAHEAHVQPFCMARTAVTNAEFSAFVDDAGYQRRECWSDAGWHWRTQAGATMPVYWMKQGANWQVR